jgi:hypothetical protein
MSTVYSSFQHYDIKGRRLSIFGTPFPDGSGMEIFILTCSKQDVFKKREGWRRYKQWRTSLSLMNAHQLGFHPSLKKTTFTKKHKFLFWCDNMFFKPKVHYTQVPSRLVLKIEEEKTQKLSKRGTGLLITYLSRS